MVSAASCKKWAGHFSCKELSTRVPNTNPRQGGTRESFICRCPRSDTGEKRPITHASRAFRLQTKVLTIMEGLLNLSQGSFDELGSLFDLRREGKGSDDRMKPTADPRSEQSVTLQLSPERLPIKLCFRTRPENIDRGATEDSRRPGEKWVTRESCLVVKATRRRSDPPPHSSRKDQRARCKRRKC